MPKHFFTTSSSLSLASSYITASPWSSTYAIGAPASISSGFWTFTSWTTTISEPTSLKASSCSSVRTYLRIVVLLLLILSYSPAKPFLLGAILNCKSSALNFLELTIFDGYFNFRTSSRFQGLGPRRIFMSGELNLSSEQCWRCLKFSLDAKFTNRASWTS